MSWVRCNDWGKEKRFILKCEYLFFRMIVYGYEILYTLFNIICFFPSWPCCSVPIMQGRCFHCIWMFYCTIFMWCRVDFCNGLGVSRQAVWSSKIGLNCWSPQSINSSNWFFIPTDHPQCLWLIQPYELAAPSQDWSQLLSVRAGAQIFKRN